MPGLAVAEGAAMVTASSKLRWRCRRGMKELDLLLERFLDRRFPAASPELQQAFAALLDCQDPELFAYFTGRDKPKEPAIARVVDAIIKPD